MRRLRSAGYGLWSYHNENHSLKALRFSGDATYFDGFGQNGANDPQETLAGSKSRNAR